MILSDVNVIESATDGPTVAIFAGVHGNEKAGVFAMQNLLPNLNILKGKLYVVFANPPAIEADVRMINKNLNRCFYWGNEGRSPEDVRARELMNILDECDSLLDLHMFYDPGGVPFVICEDNALDIAQLFDVKVISTNWTEVEPGGTDGYMFSKGKVGICVECGPIARAKEFTTFAENTVFQYLKYYGMVDANVRFSTSKKRGVRAMKAVNKTSKNFVLSPGLSNFERLKPGQLLAKDGDKSYLAGNDECIIFPHYAARVDEEAYIIGKEFSLSTSKQSKL